MPTSLPPKWMGSLAVVWPPSKLARQAAPRDYFGGILCLEAHLPHTPARRLHDVLLGLGRGWPSLRL